MNKLHNLVRPGASCTVRSISKPELLLPAAKKDIGQAVLLLHGFTGSPHDMRYLGTRLREAGYTVSIPRLPGHGTCRADFLRTDAEDWLGRAMDAWLDLKTFGLPQNLAGLSMGGILAVILAAHIAPRRLVLAAPALKTTNTLLRWTPILKHFVGVRPRPANKTYEDPDLEFLAQEYWNVDLPGPASELYRLQKLGLSLLPQVRAPVLTILSEADHTVPLSVLSTIHSAIGSRERSELILKDSSHVVVNDCDKEQVADSIIAWFNTDTAVSP